MAADLVRVPYFHGLLPREDTKSLLVTPGDFLLRTSEPTPKGKREVILSVLVQKDIAKAAGGSREAVTVEPSMMTSVFGNDLYAMMHYIFQRTPDDAKFTFKGKEYASVVDIVNHYRDNKISLSQREKNCLLLRRIRSCCFARLAAVVGNSSIAQSKKLGEGAYGEVHMGVLRRTRRGVEEQIEVAIKLAKIDGLKKTQVKDVMREARTMRHFEHPHVVCLHGVAAMQEPLMIIMELAKGGSLDSFLKRHLDLSYEKRCGMAMQAAWGLAYLHERNCLHRDIAARNCLYGDQKVKISDFGMARPGPRYQMDPSTRVPIRWLAPETMATSAYTFKSDVWSYGVLVWEIMHFARELYTNRSPRDVLHFVRSGGRLEMDNMKPDLASLVRDRIMMVKKASERATMDEIVPALEKITKLTLVKPVESPKPRKKSRVGVLAALGRVGTQPTSIYSINSSGTGALGDKSIIQAPLDQASPSNSADIIPAPPTFSDN